MDREVKGMATDAGAERPAASGWSGLLPSQVVTVLAWVVATVVIGGGIWLGARAVASVTEIVVPCAVAVLLVALLTPLNRGLRRGLPRGLAAVLSVLVFLLLLAGVVVLVGFSIAGNFDDLVGQFQQSLTNVWQGILNSSLPISDQTVTRVESRLEQSLDSLVSGAAGALLTVTETSVRVAAGALLGLFVLIFLLYDGEHVWGWLYSLLPGRASGRLEAAGEAAWVTVTGFVQGTALIAVIDAVLMGLTMYFLDVPIFLPLALLIFVGAFIPIVGALTTGSVACLVTLGTSGPVAAVTLMVALLVTNELESHVLQPFVIGRYVRLHPLAIVLAIGLGTLLGGVAGALVAVPATGVLRAAWGPLNGRESVVPVGEPSRASRIANWVRSKLLRTGG